MGNDCETPTPSQEALVSSRRDRDRLKKVVLGVLTVVAIMLSMRAWRAYANVVECERTFLLADQQMDQNRWDDALANLDHCLALNPLHYPSYDAKVYILVHVRKDKDQARATLEEALRNLPESALVHRRTGEFYLVTTAEFEKAQSELRRSCELDPTDSTARALLRQADRRVAKRP